MEKKATDYVIFVEQQDGSKKTYPIHYANKLVGYINYIDENNVLQTISSFIIRNKKEYMYVGNLIQ